MKFHLTETPSKDVLIGLVRAGRTLIIQPSSFLSGENMNRWVLALTVLLLSPVFVAPTASGQGFQTAVEIECQQDDVDVSANPRAITNGDITCTVSNPSMHPETIQISGGSDEGVQIDLSDEKVTLQPGDEKEITATVTPNVGMWAASYSITLLAEVVEVYGAPPPTYVSDETNANYEVLRYTDFMIEDCLGTSAGFNAAAPMSVYCWVFSASNFYDEYIFSVPDAGQTQLEKYGYTFNKEAYGNGVKVAESSDGTVYFDLMNLFTIEDITDEWKKAPGGESNWYSFTDWLPIEIESVYSSTVGPAHIETAEIQVTSTYAYDDNEPAPGVDDEGDGTSNPLPHLTTAHVVSTVLFAGVVAHRRQDQKALE